MSQKQPKVDWAWWKKQVELGFLNQYVYLRAKRKHDLDKKKHITMSKWWDEVCGGK